MAKKPEKTPIDPEAQYAVEMAKSVKHGRVWLRPSTERIRVSGATLLEIEASVASYALVQ